MTKVYQRFTNVTDYLEYVQSPCKMVGERASHRELTYDHWGDDDWYGRVNWDEALKLAYDGWDEGVEKVERFTESLSTIISGRIPLPEIAYGYEGVDIDYGRWHLGLPDHAVSIVDSSVLVESTSPKIVRIVINTCVSASQDADTLIMRGSAMAALALLLERHGKRVEVDVNGSNVAGPGLETWIRVKEADYPLNLANLVFLLAHPSSFRRLMFSAWEHLPQQIRESMRITPHGGYGRVGETNDRGDIYLAGLESYWASSEAATLKWITEQLREQGVEVESGVE